MSLYVATRTGPDVPVSLRTRIGLTAISGPDACIDDPPNSCQGNCELVAAQSGNPIVGADDALKALGERLKQLVAHGVSMGVVHWLEVVKVDVENGEGLACGFTTFAQPRFEKLFKAGPVEQSCQRVASGELEQAALFLLVKADVLGDTDETLDFAIVPKGDVADAEMFRRAAVRVAPLEAD